VLSEIIFIARMRVPIASVEFCDLLKQPVSPTLNPANS
jgi:hypothetical protein